MTSKTANDFIHTNAEYEKLKKGGVGRERTPRETPGAQGPGRSGFDKQFFAEWTLEELRSYAGRLGIPESDGREDHMPEQEREYLIASIEARDATAAR